MKVNTKQLQQNLKILEAAIYDTGWNEEFKYVYFTGEYLATYNGSICIAIPFKYEFKDAVPGKQFINLIQKIKDDEIEIESKEGILKISAEKIDAELTTIPFEDENDILKITDTSKLEWKPLPPDFLDGINLIKFNIEKTDITRPALTCLFIDKEKIRGATGSRASIYIMNDSINDSFLLPINSAIELSKLDNITHYNKQENSIVFKDIHGTMFHSVILDDLSFPKIEPYFEGEGKEIIFPKKIVEAIETSAVMLSEESLLNKNIYISYNDGKMACRGEKKGIGWIKSRIETDFQSEDNFEFRVNPIFFNEVLKITNKAKLIKYLAGKEKDGTEIYKTKLVFNDDNFKHVLMLWSMPDV
jgi:DNA polymerase III sliding clamp (beta) subunit (PCNA family)